MILKTSSMGKRPVYYVQKSYRNEDGKRFQQVLRDGQAVSHGGRGQPTASGSGRCLPDTSSRGSEDAGDGRRAERSNAE